MKNKPEKIISKIKDLLDELELVLGKTSHKTRSRLETKQSNQEKVPKGVIGVITMLIEDGFFNTPQTRAKIIEKLKAIGHYDKPETVSMNLLNLTKKRKLNRFKHKKYKNQWEYVIRR